MGFWQKIGSFFKNFFSNIVADPISSMSGVGKIAAGGAAAYGMATGMIPVNTATVTGAAGMVTSGLVSLGTNHTTGQVNPTIEKIAGVELKAATVALQVDPLAQSVMTAINAKGEAASAAAKIMAANDAIQSIAASVQSQAAAAPPEKQPGV
jgi:hypothetical protein